MASLATCRKITTSKYPSSLVFRILREKKNLSSSTASSSSSKSKWVLAALGLGAGAGLSLVYALDRSVQCGELLLHPQPLPWFHAGMFNTLDIASVRRGYQVYKQVCSACHSIQFVKYRHMVNAFLTEDEAKAEAAEYMYRDGPDEEGKMFERPGKLLDGPPDPYPNRQAAIAANHGAHPPDLSLITLARHGGEDYVFALLTGYQEAPAGVVLGEGQAYNPYFRGGVLSMAQQLFDEGIDYDDGTVASQSQQAKDVCNFLKWCAEPEHDTRKRWLLKMCAITPIMALFLIYLKRHTWSFLESQKYAYRVVKGREPPLKPPSPTH